MIMLALSSLVGFTSASPVHFIDAAMLDHWLNSYGRVSTGLDDADDDRDAATFAAYVQGVVDSGNGRAFCVDREIDIGDIATLTKRRMDRYREERELPASTIVGLALSGAFPCNGTAPQEQRGSARKTGKP